jgi:hypothetical protein
MIQADDEGKGVNSQKVKFMPGRAVFGIGVGYKDGEYLESINWVRMQSW